MKTVKIMCTLFAVITILNVLFSSTAAGAPPPEKIDLRILYAGHPDSAREGEFTAFLRQYFRAVETGDLAKFGPPQADGFDVVVLDYDGDGFEAPRVRLPTSYMRPTVTVGVVGGLICGQRRLKTGYL